MKKELIQSLTATFEAHPQQMTSTACSGHLPGTATRIAFSNMNRAVEFTPSTPYTLSHIRPMAVRPLDHPERWPTPWGFLFSDSGFAKGQLQ